MAQSKSNPLDAARQALKKAVKASVKSRKRKASKLSREFQRTRAAALKQQRSAADRELVAQWRALAKYGYVKTTVKPGLKRLTPFRKREIKKAFTSAQAQAAFVQGRVVRPFDRRVITTTTETVSQSGRKKQVRTRIKYDLDSHFKFLKSKHEPKQKTGFVKTKTGLMFEVQPFEKVRVTPKGQIIRDMRATGGFLITSEGVTGEDILKLADAIKAGTFKLRRGQFLDVYTFGTERPSPFDDLSLMDWVHKLERYERTMMANVFQAYIDETVIHVLTR